MVSITSFQNSFKSIYSLIFKKKEGLFGKMLVYLVNALINGFILAFPLSYFLGYKFDLFLIFACGFGMKIILDFIKELKK